MKNTLLIFVVLGLAGCAGAPSNRDVYDRINSEMGKAAEAKAQPDAVSEALLPPLVIELPKAREPLEERFNLAFNNVPASEFFVAIVSGTRYNMLVHPEVAGTISVNLKNVTLFEALDAIRELYGYDYTVDGSRIVIKPLTVQTRIFQVNYLTGVRKGNSDIRVTSGAVSESSSGGAASAPSAAGTTSSSTNTLRSLETSKINTASTSDFWSELKAALEAIVGGGKDKDKDKESNNVIISPQSGVVVVRALPEQLRNVAAYLKATQLSVDRQVILEAKILEVQLNDSYQSGINWASFASFRGGTLNRASTGFVSPGATLAPLNADGTPSALASIGATAINALSGATLGAADTAAGSLFGLAFQTSNFAALISFLESQGTVHVLSSPRIATLNNQKAVLKIGTDELFVTNVTSTTSTTIGSSTNVNPPSVTLQSFFSGVVLDVTPQIDERGNIILHIRPSVSQVTSVNKSIDVGGTRPFNLPVPSSNTSETDSVVRGRDGHIIAIGGLMRQSTTSDRSQLPGAGSVPVVGELFKNTNQVTQKRELVILLKPTIVQENGTWAEDLQESQRRIQSLDPRNAAPLYNATPQTENQQ